MIACIRIQLHCIWILVQLFENYYESKPKNELNWIERIMLIIIIDLVFICALMFSEWNEQISLKIIHAVHTQRFSGLTNHFNAIVICASLLGRPIWVHVAWKEILIWWKLIAVIISLRPCNWFIWAALCYLNQKKKQII